MPAIEITAFFDLANLYMCEILADLHQTAFANTDQSGWSAADFQTMSDNPHVHHFTLLKDHKPVGIIAYSLVLDEAEILTFAIALKQQSQGLGQYLLEFSLDALKQKGGKNIFLEVKANNDRALNLYTKMGFKTIDTRKNYYTDSNGIKSDAIIMRF